MISFVWAGGSPGEASPHLSPLILTRTSNLEVTNAIYALARARDNVVDATFRLNAAQVNLARSIGRLDELR